MILRRLALSICLNHAMTVAALMTTTKLQHSHLQFFINAQLHISGMF